MSDTPPTTRGHLPNVVVIGAAKAGTTALHYYLSLHPEAAMSHPKELNFFVDKRVAAGPGFNLTPEELRFGPAAGNWSKGVAWYQQHFPEPAPVRGEASPDYTAPWYPGCAERMASVIPHAKLIFVARDPVERALTHYLTLRGTGHETRDPEVALARLDGVYVSRSRYHALTEPYFRSFDRSRILVLDQEELRSDRAKTLAAVYQFVGIDPGFWSERFERERNPTTARPRHLGVERWATRLGLRSVVSRFPPEVKWRIERAFLAMGGPADLPRLKPGVRRQIAEHLHEDAARFRQLTGKAFATWSV